MWELQDQNMVIIFSQVDPSILVTYNTVSGTHSVWRVRRATAQEADKCLYLPSSVSDSKDQELSGTPSSHQSIASCTPSRLHSTNSPSQSRSIGTPFHSRPGTPSHSRSLSRSNSPMSTMASMIRTGDKQGVQSPTLLSKVQARFSSPVRGSGKVLKQIIHNSSGIHGINVIFNE